MIYSKSANIYHLRKICSEVVWLKTVFIKAVQNKYYQRNGVYKLYKQLGHITLKSSLTKFC